MGWSWKGDGKEEKKRRKRETLRSREEFQTTDVGCWNIDFNKKFLALITSLSQLEGLKTKLNLPTSIKFSVHRCLFLINLLNIIFEKPGNPR